MRVLEGHPFIVEAAVSLGGRDIRPGINVYRFANRIPLLFEVTHTTVEYGQPSTRAAVLARALVWATRNLTCHSPDVLAMLPMDCASLQSIV